MKKRIHSILIYFLLVALSGASFLFSPEPRPGIDYHGKYIHINKSMGFFLNYDAYAFCELAENPEKIFNKNELRQSRPLYILLGTLVYHPVKLTLSLIGMDMTNTNSIGGIGDDNSAQKKSTNIIPAYIGYVILNALFLVLCLVLFEFILSGAGVSRFSIFLFSFILLFNPIVKAFFWTAHQQILNLLTPLSCIYLLMQISNWKTKISVKQLCLISIVSGSLMLLYGNVLLLLPVIIMSAWLNGRFTGNAFPFWYMILIVLTFLIPTFCWILFLEVFANGYFSHELASYRQFIWIIDYLKEGIIPFLRQWMIFTNQYFSTLFLVFIFLALACILNLKSRIQFAKKSLNPGLASLMVFIISFFFFWFLGFYADRLSFTMIPTLLVMIAIGADLNFRIPATRLISIVIIAGWVIYQVVSYGPFS